MKVALVHDWLTGMRGGEKCLECLCELFPDATIFTMLHEKGSVSKTIEKMKIKTSFIQKLPLAFKHYRYYLPLFPKAIESFDLNGFDLVISSSHCVAKGVKKPKAAMHLCYCYTPMRYVWVFFEQYFGKFPFWKKELVKLFSDYLKDWDISSLYRVDEFMAISETIKERIAKIYHRDSKVIYPPVDTAKFSLNQNIKKEDYYLCVSALVPYKRVDVIVKAFNRLKDKKIIIVGDGDIRNALERESLADNIIFLGWVKDEVLRDLYQRAKAFIYAAEEDFGIAPLEAQATGLAVIAYGKGGVAETIIPINSKIRLGKPTGIFFYEQAPESLISAIGEFERRILEFNPIDIRENALRFSRDNFMASIKCFIEEKAKGAGLC